MQASAGDCPRWVVGERAVAARLLTASWQWLSSCVATVHRDTGASWFEGVLDGTLHPKESSAAVFTDILQLAEDLSLQTTFCLGDWFLALAYEVEHKGERSAGVTSFMDQFIFMIWSDKIRSSVE